MPSDWLPSWLYNVVFSLARWMHVIATTLLIGGTLFFEFVVPRATEDLITEQQLSVFGRARFYFRSVVWLSVALLLVSGGLGLWREWRMYHTVTDFQHSFPYVIAHLCLGLVGMALAVRLASSRHLVNRPVGWMQVNLIVLLVTVFLANLAPHIRLRFRDWYAPTVGVPAGQASPPAPPAPRVAPAATPSPNSSPARSPAGEPSSASGPASHPAP